VFQELRHCIIVFLDSVEEVALKNSNLQTMRRQPMDRPTPSLAPADASLERVQYKIYESIVLAPVCRDPGSSDRRSEHVVRRVGEVPKPQDELIGIIEAPYLSCVQRGLLFIHLVRSFMSSKALSNQPDWLADPRNSDFTLIVLKALEALEAARRREHDLALIWDVATHGSARRSAGHA